MGPVRVPVRVVCFQWCVFDINPHVTPAQIISLVVDRVEVMLMMVVVMVLWCW